MGTKSNIIPSENLGNIDLNSQGFRDDGSVRAAIEGGKTYKQIIQGVDKELSSMMKDMTSYTHDLDKALNEMTRKMESAGKGYKEAFSNSLLFKKTKEDLITLTRAMEEYNKAAEDKNISDKELFDLWKKTAIAYQESSDALEGLTTATIDQNDSVSDLRANLKVLYSEVKNGSKQFGVEFKDIVKGIINASKASDKLNKRVADFSSTLSSTVSGLKSMLSLEKLSNGIGPSTQMQIQTQLQQRYGLSNGQFYSLKRNVYGSFDNSLYSSEQVLQTMQSLNSMGIKNKEDIVKYFDKILEGQQLLGMSAETQTALMQLSNKTGRDELTLGTNTFAKYIKEITNVSKEQLNQLVSINTNFASQMADLGVSGDAFDSMTAAINGALTKASGGTELAGLYTQSMTAFANSTDLSAEMLGMTSGQFKTFLSNGGNYLDLLASGRGRAGNYYKLMTSNRDFAIAHQDELTQGMDSSTVNFINQVTRLQQEGKLTKDLLNKFKGLDGAAIEAELKDIKKNNMTTEEKILNRISNFIDKKGDWKGLNSIMNRLTFIANTTAIIAGLVGLSGKLGIGKSLGKGLLNLLGTTGSVHVAGSGSGILGGLVSLGVAGGATSTLGAGLLGAGMVGIPLLGVGLAGYDAYQGYKSGGAKGAVRQFFLGSAHSGQSNSDMTKSELANVGKWGLVGAGIGTFIGGPVGTLVGGLIGAGVGSIAAGIGGTMKKTTDEQRETNKKLDKVVTNTAKSANALSIREVGRTTVSTIPYSSKAEGSKAKGSKAKGSAGSPARAMGGPVGIGGTRGLKFGVSSPYGSRSFDGWHYGVDFSGGNINGAPLYSNVSGTVVDVGKDPDGANFVGVKGSDGYIHYYWHMIAPSNRKVGDKVDQGDLVGYVGSTGNSTGPHLHYQVTRSRYSDGYRAFLSNSVNPESFATNAIFSGTAAYYNPDYDGLDASNSSSSVSTSSLLASINKKTANIKLATFGSPHGSTGIINSIVDLKNTIVGLSNQATANEKLMRAITNTYNTQPRMS